MVQYFEQRDRGVNLELTSVEDIVEIVSDLGLESSFDDY